MMAWKYTLPAFLVPFMFTLHPDGVGLLFKGTWSGIVLTTVTAMVGLAALGAGLVLVYPGWLQDAIGLALFTLAIVLQAVRAAPAGANSSARS